MSKKASYDQLAKEVNDLRTQANELANNFNRLRKLGVWLGIETTGEQCKGDTLEITIDAEIKL